MKKILITRKIIKSSEELALKIFNVKLNKQDKLLRVPKFAEIPYPAIMEPSLVIEYYSR